MSRMVVCLSILSLVFGVAVASARDVTLDDIRRAIEEQGANWRAEATTVWQRSDSELAEMMGGALEPVDAEMYVVDDPYYMPMSRAQFDWRNNGGNWMTPVTNQGCNDCWAHASCGAQEAAMNIALNDPDADWNMSEQFLISCGFNCNAQYLNNVLNYLRDTGTVRETCFPYSGSYNPPYCSDRCANWSYDLWNINSYGYTPNGDVGQMKSQLANGPMIVWMNVYSDFLTYSGGVYEHTSGSSMGGHFVVLVGYNDDDPEGACWICKNSWGTGWGEDTYGLSGEAGYFRIAMGSNESGIETYPTFITQSMPDFSVPATGPIGLALLLAGLSGLLFIRRRA
ncbi:hypothetical protein JW905_00825 [bacterium]|nr:hypothetical protein [candidate division CSSED10-310 bacterium]